MKTREEYLAAADELERAVELTPDGMLSQARDLRNLAAQASQVPEQEQVAFLQEGYVISPSAYTAPAPAEHTAEKKIGCVQHDCDECQQREKLKERVAGRTPPTMEQMRDELIPHLIEEHTAADAPQQGVTPNVKLTGAGTASG